MKIAFTALIAAGVTFVSLSHHAQAASFSCNNAASAQEKLICASPLLGQLDEELAQVWKTSRAFLTAYDNSAPWEKTLNQFQRSWLTTRDQCKDEDCLRQRYQQQLNRLRYLNDIAQHAPPSPITPVKSTACFHGSFNYEYVMSGLSAEEYRDLGDYFREMYDQKAPYHAVSLTMTNQRGKIEGGASIAFRYGNKLDDSDFTARQMSDTQAIGKGESSFGQQVKILLTCIDDDHLQIATFGSNREEGYLFNYLLERDKTPLEPQKTP
ncbi:lysozyme inhibitor LprI family protein [Pectobacterium brasiliense]|uniref:lysozyme inhibitor LprI family protein n=1 Tax=Pectobacterium brasiliense TaxID=180957 RepID=UPI001CE14F71|nr:lysozyme inhibitor LprI family protein [Pectobacterium brasiliense]MCA5920945.1 lysozyme inhibitor LprI family protein [Pectobacterium brasiliense]MCA5927065.1 lysozyme inhibitor LprI family protein [Pectobacterium brasiliense]MCA5937140.1 lysozyme inhibitor LprI family protein [Pectobacterium brasiliense]MCA5941048.1 lysozyme inhibitor LprI family protein [Pectobacterium brasiliense]MCA5943847.1 lysozyme inhibitor LprI family protein [Pectobacterium brasiliense]